MGRVIQFPGNPSSGFGLKKVKGTKKVERQEELGQLNIFAPAKEGRVIQMPEGGDYFEHAIKLDESGDSLAKEAYSRAVEMGQSSADALCNLGVLQYNNGEENEALDSFTKALGIDARHREAHFNLANLYSEKGNAQLAILHYEAAISVDSNFSDGFYNLGLVLITDRQFKKALKILSAYRMMTHGDDKEVNGLIDNLKMTLDNE